MDFLDSNHNVRVWYVVSRLVEREGLASCLIRNEQALVEVMGIILEFWRNRSIRIGDGIA